LLITYNIYDAAACNRNPLNTQLMLSRAACFNSSFRHLLRCRKFPRHYLVNQILRTVQLAQRHTFFIRNLPRKL